MCKRKNQPQKPLLPTEFPDGPWAKVGADLFQWNVNQYLLVVDYFSRFIEVAKLTSTTSLAVVEVYLRQAWHTVRVHDR